MFVVGADVTVNDNYSGKLSNVVGRTGKIVRIEGDNYALDITGGKPSYWNPNVDWQYPVIVKASEINLVDYEFKDVNGVALKIGDKVHYSGHRPGIIVGTVVGFKRGPRGRWDNTEVTKVQLEVESRDDIWDGYERRISKTVTRRNWYENGGRMVAVLQPNQFIVTSKLNGLNIG